MLVFLGVAVIMIIVLALLALHIYGVVACFKANAGWGVISIFVSPLAFAVGIYQLITGQNFLIKDGPSAK